MIPASWIISGAATLASAAIGAWLGYDYRDAQAGRERAAELQASARATERAIEAREAARAIAAATGARIQAALQKAQDASRPPIKCPETGDIRDAVLPGLGDRLRAVRAAAEPAASSVGAVQPAGSTR